VRRRLGRLVFVALLASAVGGASAAPAAHASGSAKRPAVVVEKKKKHKKKAKPVSLATAARWVHIGAEAKLTPSQPAPQPQPFTDPAGPPFGKISSTLIAGLGFKGVAIETFARTQPDPADPTLLVGNYIVKVVVFGSAADAKKFRDADAKDVTNRPPSTVPGLGNFKQVGSYADGVVLDDAMGHINLMFTIGNVAVDIRLGVTEKAPGDGATAIKKLGDVVVANSKKKT